MSSFREESQGVVSLRLYESRECRKIVDSIKELDGWNPALIRQGQEGGNYDIVARSDIRSASTLNTADVERLYDEFEQKVDSLVKPLIRRLWKLDLKNHSGTHLLKYEAADHYIPHRDTGLGFEGRYFSVVCYLNDDFIGGRTLFPTLNYAVTPEAGQAILFPSNYLHGSEAVISGKKFAFVSWIDGPVPIRWF
ncbi:MAG: 2OG-Fe(II) oxygenase [Acidobacteriota bacterium]|nr:2OG-Fe(II) oxygenase [Acidobacteriota bacterium]